MVYLSFIETFTELIDSHAWTPKFPPLCIRWKHSVIKYFIFVYKDKTLQKKIIFYVYMEAFILKNFKNIFNTL